MQYSLFTCVDDEYWYLWYYTNNQIAGDQKHICPFEGKNKLLYSPIGFI